MEAHMLAWKRFVEPSDRVRILEIVLSTGAFSEEEADIAVELVDERLAHGGDSGYEFLLAEAEGRLAGYTCFGRVPGTLSSFDLYWIVVAPERQRKGVGGLLLMETERAAREKGATRIYADTSSSPGYEAARRFYEACGYRREAFLPDFYRPGDGKVIYARVLTRNLPDGENS
ncbi:MAG: GNAT family N-acetyltransferase [Deltaproteobacteria bacterium HGW-Deltaproteobacteria-19]|jgi:GNAT superfamily N-acetyltransferase|nr:MAG: GNAT family N-acetyltransferase [Deltaproteobacteria bacterium HGW-Deltaproteobacteria-19]